MKWLLFIGLFIVGAAVGMAIVPLLPNPIQKGISSLHLEIEYQVGIEERPGEMANSAAPTPNTSVRDSPLTTYTPTPSPSPRIGISPLPTPTSTPFPTATAKPTPTALPTPTPTATATPTPTQTPTSPPMPTMEDLRQLALDLINRDRADHGLPPVVLGSNVAAQRHANDMLENNYLGHWWTDGSKPYMVYTRTGGRSYVAENAAFSGWTDRQWESNGCDSLFVTCSVPDLAETITTHQYSMMYDDAHADWGHRDNILRASHRAVNIGIAFNARRVIFVQHFEGGSARARGAPELSDDNVLSLVMDKTEEGIQIGGVVTIYYDPPPEPMTSQAIDALDSYCVGGGATTRCGDPVVRILDPPGAGRYYANLDHNEVVADSWLETSDYFILGADVGNLMRRPGVYTVIVWRYTGGTRFSEVIIQLSVFVE